MKKINFRDNLKKFREKNGYSGKEFANVLGISYQKYMNYENKGSEPKYELLILIAKKLDVSIDELLGKAGNDPYDRLKKIVEDCGFSVDDTFSIDYIQIRPLDTITMNKEYSDDDSDDDSDDEETINVIYNRQNFIRVIGGIVDDCDKSTKTIIKERISLLFDPNYRRLEAEKAKKQVIDDIIKRYYADKQTVENSTKGENDIQQQGIITKSIGKEK